MWGGGPLEASAGAKGHNQRGNVTAPLAFQHLFLPVLRPGGVYVLEDTAEAFRTHRLDFFTRDLLASVADERCGAPFEASPSAEMQTRSGNPCESAPNCKRRNEFASLVELP